MKPFRVVCIDNFISSGLPIPIKGEIYTVVGYSVRYPKHYYILREFSEIGADGRTSRGFRIPCFREVDETFGELVCSMIEKEPEPKIFI